MWKEIADIFSEERRHYKDTYLEISEIIEEDVECSLFSREGGPYEIYISFDPMDVIVYVEKE